METDGYIFSDSEEDFERRRLSALEAIFDPATKRRLERIGIGPGRRCLELGPGGGSVARWMCESVGDDGHVMAIDLDPKFLAEDDDPRLEVRAADIRTADLAPDSVDIAHARYVLVHIPEYADVFETMLRALKPSGWILIEDVDIISQAPSGDDADAAAIARVFDSVGALFDEMGMDGTVGRRLPALFQRYGLRDIGVATDMPLVAGGSPMARMMGMSLGHLATRLVGTGVASSADMDVFARCSADPTAWMYHYTTVAVWGRKPGPA